MDIECNKRKYNFNSIGDLLDYRKYLIEQIKKYNKSEYLYHGSYFYVRYCIGLLKCVNILIKKKGY